MTAGDAPTFRWLHTGHEALTAMLAAIRAARRSIRLEFYIFSAAPPGREFLEALVEARQRQVRVQVLIDAVGSFGLPQSFWKPLLAAGGEFRWFNSIQFARLGYRNHRKILVVDEQTACIGGFNIAPEYNGDGVSWGWRDLGLHITGPPAAELARAADAMFAQACTKLKLAQKLRRARTEIKNPHGRWQLLLSGPGLGHRLLKRAVTRDVAQARSVQIICGYFLPSWSIRRALRRAARAGRKVQLMLAGQSDVPLSRLASHRLYQGLLLAGVEIYEYQPQILHTKLIILDDRVHVGSANLDARSLNINYELLARLDDPALAAEARKIFARDLKHCRRIDPATWKQSRNLCQKLLERWAYFLFARVDPYLARWTGRPKSGD
ncbi:MAG: hypothetical protein EXS33_04300 [Pedosphaera sp.]|nr:hypothetical protein [Pedosphaera sp.]